MVNPYASEDFNRIRVNPRNRENEDKRIDHPLVEGKKLDMDAKELKAFTKAMEQDEFKSLLSEYVGEISDPKHRPELDQYLKELVERGELPPGCILIQPKAGFCIKTSAKKMSSDIHKTFFEQKCFINVCFHEAIEKPKQESVTQPDGKKGNSWQLPYRISKGKPDQDNKGALVMTYDCVFHPDVLNFCIHSEFKKFTCDTAVDGVNRVVQENKEKISSDYKVLKHINCKGERPHQMMFKKVNENPLLANMDLNNVKTKLQKETEAIVAEQKAKEAAAKGEAPPKIVQQTDEDESEKSDDERPTGIVQPKYKIVHSYPANLGDHWEGHKDSVEG